jgi:hypothetical protein
MKAEDYKIDLKSVRASLAGMSLEQLKEQLAKAEEAERLVKFAKKQLEEEISRREKTMRKSIS